MAAEEEFHDFYKYTPSKAAAGIFIALFLVTTCFHIVQLVRRRVWFFIPIAVGGFFEIIGYAARIISTTEAPLFTDTPYIIQSLFLLLAPALFAASIYMELGRIIALLQGEQHAVIRRTWMTKVFVTGDVLSFVVQGAGGGIMSSGTPSNLSLGQNVIIVGLAIQLLFFGFFIVTTSLFHRRMIAYPTSASFTVQISWRKHILTLYVVSVLIILRSIFRVAEYVLGNDGALLKSEVYLFVFDAALMWILMVVLNVVHPGEVSEALVVSEVKSGDSRMEMNPFDEERLGGAREGLSEERVRVSNDRGSARRAIYARHGLV
ncbi:hypothetical protein FQN54_004768 [Arachnomyces sp. PD_36]|nr:hypothetical protein FQN54_004768 [Arachnomyces sp. PD_36]